MSRVRDDGTESMDGEHSGRIAENRSGKALRACDFREGSALASVSLMNVHEDCLATAALLLQQGSFTIQETGWFRERTMIKQRKPNGFGNEL